jgi:hypothetical protein
MKARAGRADGELFSYVDPGGPQAEDCINTPETTMAAQCHINVTEPSSAAPTEHRRVRLSFPQGATQCEVPVNSKALITSVAAMAASFAMGWVPGAAAQGQTFSFGLWGDMPYEKANDAPKIPALIDSINASDIAFSLYDGDIKDGSSKCTDGIYADGLTMFGQMKKPVVYLPGDNEWTDCHRTNNGGYDNLERLAYLRKVMFPSLDSLGQSKMPLDHQGKLGEKFVENIRFIHGGIVFVGLNIPGSNNNKVLDEKDCTSKSARTAALCTADNAEYEERDAANIAWMQDAFRLAKEQNAPGVMIVFQGDPGFDLPETEELNERKAPIVSGYTDFLNKVVTETEAFHGQVVLVHGDTHFFKVDKPLYSPTNLLPNLTRVETFGSPSIHWIRVTVDPASEEVFTFHPVLVRQK